VKDLFDKSFIEVTELSMHLRAYRYVSSVSVLLLFPKKGVLEKCISSSEMVLVTTHLLVGIFRWPLNRFYFDSNLLGTAMWICIQSIFYH
jgi:hypothetical protein